MKKLHNPLKPDPYKPNPAAPVNPLGAPTGAAARLGINQSNGLTQYPTHPTPTKVPQHTDSKLSLIHNDIHGLIKSLAPKPITKTADDFTQLKMLLNNLAIVPVPDSLISILGRR